MVYLLSTHIVIYSTPNTYKRILRRVRFDCQNACSRGYSSNTLRQGLLRTHCRREARWHNSPLYWYVICAFNRTCEHRTDKTWPKDRHLVHEVTSPVSFNSPPKDRHCFRASAYEIANSKLSRVLRMQAVKYEDRIVLWPPLIMYALLFYLDLLVNS